MTLEASALLVSKLTGVEESERLEGNGRGGRDETGQPGQPRLWLLLWEQICSPQYLI